MANTFYIELEPVKRNKVWVVSVFIVPSSESRALLDSEHSFDTKRDAKLFIAGWCEFLNCYKRT